MGVTGPAMRAAGCESWADVDALSLFGIAEVIGQIPRLLRLRRRLFQRVRDTRPAAFIGIDAPAFNTGLERRVKKLGVPTVHYVCPTAWAWRAGRTRSIRRAVDRLLAIFPFEPAFFERHAIPTTFVGHPLADARPLTGDRVSAREALGLATDGMLVGVLPGSRGSEIEHIGPAFIDTARWLAARRDGIRFVAAIAAPRLRVLFEAQLAERAPDLDILLIDGRSREVMRAVDALLVASGTATLEALLEKTPMAVAYRVSAVTYWLARVFRLIKVAQVSMPNLLAGRALVPEFLQHDATAARMGAAVLELLESQSARRAPDRCVRDNPPRARARRRSARRGRSGRADRRPLMAGDARFACPLVAGVDEVGRGPLAGPVVAAAVILPAHGWPQALADSKALSATARETLDARSGRGPWPGRWARPR